MINFDIESNEITHYFVFIVVQHVILFSFDVKYDRTRNNMYPCIQNSQTNIQFWERQSENSR